MRKILSLFFVMALCVVGLSAQGLVQGQPHPSAPNVPVKPKSQLRADASFSFDDIQFWVGSGSKRAALVIEGMMGINRMPWFGDIAGMARLRTRYDRGDSEGRSETSFINPIYGLDGLYD